MARPKKEKLQEVINEIQEIIEDEPKPETLSESNIEKNIQSEVLFLEELLETIVSGSWHGPAASIIKERLKLLKG